MSHCDSEPDDAAWLRSVFDQYEGQLVRYAARLLGDAERARDVAQDTFLRLCHEPRAKVEPGLRPWLFTVCRHRALDVLRKESRMRTLHEDEAQPTRLADDHVAEIARRETSGRAIALLRGLPENQREVIRLKVEHDLSYREISQVTGLSVSNVGFLLHIARSFCNLSAEPRNLRGCSRKLDYRTSRQVAQ